MENEKTERPWDPCEDCLRPLAAKFREWSHDDSRIDKLRHPAIVEGWYRDYATVVCRRWLEFNVSPEYADRFQAHLDGPLDRLRAWQKRCDLGAFNDMDDVGDEYESICCDVAKSAEFMYQLAVMIDGKAESLASERRKETTTTVLVVSISPPQVTLPDGTTHTLGVEAAKLLNALVQAEYDWINAGEVVGQPARVRNSMPQPVRVLIEAAAGRGTRLKPLA